MSKHHFFSPYSHKGFRRNCSVCGLNAQDDIHLFKGTDYDYAQIASYFNWDIDDPRTKRFLQIVQLTHKRLTGGKKKVDNKMKWRIIKESREELAKELEQIKNLKVEVDEG